MLTGSRKKILKYRSAADGVRPFQVKCHAFRMPLEGQYGQRFMDHGLDRAVKGSCNGNKASARPGDGLMVTAVDGKDCFLVQAVEE